MPFAVQIFQDDIIEVEVGFAVRLKYERLLFSHSIFVWQVILIEVCMLFACPKSKQI